MYWFNTIVIFFKLSSPFGSVVKMIQFLYLRVAIDRKLDTFLFMVFKGLEIPYLQYFSLQLYKLIKICG